MKKLISIFFVLIIAFGICGFKKKKPQVPLVMPKPEYTFVDYNFPPGKKEIDLVKLKKVKMITSAPVVSPDYQKMAFVQTGFLPSINQIVPFLYYIYLDSEKSEMDRVLKADVKEKIEIPLEKVNLEPQVFRTYTIVDWSKDSQSLLIKEQIGENQRNLWQTNIWVYDFDFQEARKIIEIRKIITSYWRNSRTFDLNSITWDINPLGWDSNHPDRIVLKAFGIGKNDKKFLGLWSIDYRGQDAHLLSLKDPTTYNVGSNGMILKKKKDETWIVK